MTAFLKQQPVRPIAQAGSRHISLHELVDQLTVPAKSSAGKKIFFQNDVPLDSLTNADEQILATALNYLLTTVANRCEGCVKISAKSYNNIVLVYVENPTKCTLRAGIHELEMAQLLAGRLGGCVTINDNRKSGTLLTLSFLNS